MVEPRAPRPTGAPGLAPPTAAAGGEDGGVGKKEKMLGKNVGPKNVGAISMAISTNSTFHKNVVTFLKNVERILKREKYCPTFLKMLTKNS
jgi:hypothetical protein